MIGYLTFGMVYAFASVVQPGPFQAYLISQSLTHGWRRTLPIVFAPLLSDGPIAVLALFVLSVMPHWLLQGLQLAGGFLLFYLAFGAYNTWRTFEHCTTEAAPGQQTVLKAALVNFLNPGPYLGWTLVLAPLLLKAWSESPAYGLSLLLGFYATMILSSAALVVAFAAARNFGHRVHRVSIGLSALALACFGLYQVWSGAGALQLFAPVGW